MRTAEDALFALLDRQVHLSALDALVGSLRPAERDQRLEETAIGLDANVFLRLPGNRKGVDIVDYLASGRNAPLILPGQVIQEFWNNQLQAVQTVATTIQKKFDAFRLDLSSVDPNFVSYSSEILDILDRFNSDHGYVYAESTLRSTVSFIEMLQERAIVPFASRQRFRSVARQRKATKTPPGFRDDGDGDFFVWIDFLMGLLQAKRRGMSFSRAVLVSNDQKSDWSRGGVAHPILAAEVRALLDIPFEIWTLDQFAAAMEHQSEHAP